MHDEKLNTEDDATEKPSEPGSVGFPDGEDKPEKEEK